MSPSHRNLTEEYLKEEVFSKFQNSLQRDQRQNLIYLANHSLGRQLDQTPADIAEGLAVWRDHMENSWSDSHWMGELRNFQSKIAQIVGASSPGSIIPKSSAGQGLRAVLNANWVGKTLKVVTTSVEFDSADTILKAYERAGLIEVTWIPPTRTSQGVSLLDEEDIAKAISKGCDVVCLSHVYFQTGQLLTRVKELTNLAHQLGAIVLLDVYHSAGCVPLTLTELDVDFAVGGCYKYLRGGPGTGFLYVNPLSRALENPPLDVGWFALKMPFQFERSPVLELADGPNAWMESTFPALISYQARAGLELVTQVTVAAIREHSLSQQSLLRAALKDQGVPVFEPSDPTEFGAFTLVVHPRAKQLESLLKAHGVIADSRGPYLRICPDLLTTNEEIAMAAKKLKVSLQSLE